ncbi:hypothetical protein ambt_09650 [Alteromonas naphthalenivorans]|uniref:Uncharacterized protein n=1 Tax=Alteromonas naphthalenivorans TaxID=715451 RepID=F5Z8R3_ALTNA|nr:hypothetical protein ambt_09650 [Alteromonas naphthalenivorans]
MHQQAIKLPSPFTFIAFIAFIALEAQGFKNKKNATPFQAQHFLFNITRLVQQGH